MIMDEYIIINYDMFIIITVIKLLTRTPYTTKYTIFIKRINYYIFICK